MLRNHPFQAPLNNTLNSRIILKVKKTLEITCLYHFVMCKVRPESVVVLASFFLPAFSMSTSAFIANGQKSTCPLINADDQFPLS